MILRALDLQGLHQEAADGLDQWLRLPMELQGGAGCGRTSRLGAAGPAAGPLFRRQGLLTHAEAYQVPAGTWTASTPWDRGAIMFTLMEHFRLTGDLDWLKAHAPRLKANAEWILRQRHPPGRPRSRRTTPLEQGLQPAHVVTPDSERMHMQFYESEAYYWLAVKRFAELLALIDPE